MDIKHLIIFLLFVQAFDIMKDIQNIIESGELSSDNTEIEEQYYEHIIKDYYKNQNEIIVQLDDLYKFMPHEEAQTVWQALVTLKTGTRKISYRGFYELGTEPDYTVPLLSLSLLALLFVVYSYRSNSLLLLNLSSSALTGLSYTAGVKIPHETGSSLLFLLSAVSFLVFLQSIICFFTQEKPFSQIKTFIVIVGVLFCYILSYQSSSFLIQLPFLLFLDYLVLMLGLKLNHLMPLYLQPFWAKLLFAYSLFIVNYVYSAGENAFVIEELRTKPVEFGEVTYAVCSLNLLVTAPIIVYVYYYKQHNEFRTGVANFDLINETKCRKRLTEVFYSEWVFEDLFLVVFLAVALLEIGVGLTTHIYALAVVGHLSLIIVVVILPRAHTVFPDFLIYPVLYIPVIVVPTLLDGHVYGILRVFGCAVSLYGLASSHLLVKRPYALVLQYLIRYALTILIICVMEEDSSFLIQGFLSLVAMNTNLHPVMANNASKLERFASTLCWVVIGMRINLISSENAITFCIGIVLMVMSIYRNFQYANDNISSYFLALTCSLVYLVYALCLRSAIVLVSSLFIILGIVAIMIQPDHWKVTMSCLVCILFLGFNSFNLSFEELFEAVQLESQKVDLFKAVLGVFEDPSKIYPEKEFIINMLRKLKNI